MAALQIQAADTLGCRHPRVCLSGYTYGILKGMDDDWTLPPTTHLVDQTAAEILANAAPEAARRMVELAESENENVALKATVWLLEHKLGKAPQAVVNLNVQTTEEDAYEKALERLTDLQFKQLVKRLELPSGVVVEGE